MFHEEHNNLIDQVSTGAYWHINKRRIHGNNCIPLTFIKLTNVIAV